MLKTVGLQVFRVMGIHEQIAVVVRGCRQLGIGALRGHFSANYYLDKFQWIFSKKVDTVKR